MTVRRIYDRLATEDAYQVLAQCGEFPPQPDNPALHTLHSLTGFVQEALGLRGPAQTISTACSSSAKAFACAERLMRLGLVDAAVVGGVYFCPNVWSRKHRPVHMTHR